MTFTASNGVELDKWGSLESPPSVLAARDLHEARAEFYQHLRDEELGRWRWPANPDYVVYPQHDGSVLVIFERIGESSILYRRDDPVHDMEGETARAYFDAHPVPWHDAREGEVWVLTLTNGQTHPAIFQAGAFRDTGGSWGMDEIESARRIWPEAS